MYDIKKDIKVVQKQSSVIVGFWRVVTVDLENVRNPMGIICTKHVKKRRPVVKSSTVI